MGTTQNVLSLLLLLTAGTRLSPVLAASESPGGPRDEP